MFLVFEFEFVGGFCFGFILRVLKLFVFLALEFLKGFSGDICLGYEVDVEEDDRKLVKGFLGFLR